MLGPVIVTRPAEPGRRLASALRQRGYDVAWWPAFDIAPPSDEAAVRGALERLAVYDLAIFVSPNAVHATAARLPGNWPPSTAIGAVGASTLEAARAELPGAAGAAMVAPDDGDESGSEGFLRAWHASGRSARRVLLLRAATGRDWIIERLRAAGSQVETLAIYSRVPHALAGDDRSRLARWAGEGADPTTIISSAEAVDAVLEQVSCVAGAERWLKSGRTIATHPRIAQRLEAAGFLRITVSDPSDSVLIDRLESPQG